MNFRFFLLSGNGETIGDRLAEQGTHAVDAMSRTLPNLAIALLLFATPLFAQTETYYRVEIVLFANNNTSAAAVEFWPEAEYPDLSRAIDLDNPPTGFSSPDPQSLTLGGIAARLDQSGNYRLIRHISWIQPGLPESAALPVLMGSSGNVVGTVTLTLSRYLHLNTDMVFYTAVDGLPVAARVSDSRRMRSRELHYIDHPLLGVIAEITPIE